MSETVCYTGKAIKVVSGDIEGVAQQILADKHVKLEKYYKSAIEQLCCDFDEEFFVDEKTTTLYTLETNRYSPEDELIEATSNEDGTIDFRLVYYNGGAGFHECLQEAFDNLNKNETK